MVFPSFTNPFSRHNSTTPTSPITQPNPDSNLESIIIPNLSRATPSNCPIDLLHSSDVIPPPLTLSASRFRSQSVAASHPSRSSSALMVNRPSGKDHSPHHICRGTHHSTPPIISSSYHLSEQSSPRKKHPRPPPLSLSARKVSISLILSLIFLISNHSSSPHSQLGQAMVSSIGMPGSPRLRSASSGGAFFEMVGASSSLRKESLPPLPNSAPRLISSHHIKRKSESKRGKETRRRGVPLEISRPSIRRRASSLDSASTSFSPKLSSSKALSPEGLLSFRKTSNASTVPSCSECSEGTLNLSPGPSTAYTTPASSASRPHFDQRNRQCSLGNPIRSCSDLGVHSHFFPTPHSSSPISPRTKLDPTLPNSPLIQDGPRLTSTNLLIGSNEPPWNVRFPGPSSTPSSQQIIPDGAGLLLEIGQGHGSSQRSMLEPVLHKSVEKDGQGKESIKWEVRLMLPPRRYGSSPAVGITPPVRIRKTSRTTALKMSSTSTLSVGLKDHLPSSSSYTSSSSVKPRRRGSSLMASPVLASPSLSPLRPVLGVHTTLASNPHLVSPVHTHSPTSSSHSISNVSFTFSRYPSSFLYTHPTSCSSSSAFLNMCPSLFSSLYLKSQNIKLQI